MGGFKKKRKRKKGERTFSPLPPIPTATAPSLSRLPLSGWSAERWKRVFLYWTWASILLVPHAHIHQAKIQNIYGRLSTHTTFLRDQSYLKKTGVFNLVNWKAHHTTVDNHFYSSVCDCIHFLHEQRTRLDQPCPSAHSFRYTKFQRPTFRQGKPWHAHTKASRGCSTTLIDRGHISHFESQTLPNTNHIDYKYVVC